VGWNMGCSGFSEPGCHILTDSVFHVLFVYFDESMGSIGGYVWVVSGGMNHGEVGI